MGSAPKWPEEFQQYNLPDPYETKAFNHDAYAPSDYPPMGTARQISMPAASSLTNDLTTTIRSESTPCICMTVSREMNEFLIESTP